MSFFDTSSDDALTMDDVSTTTAHVNFDIEEFEFMDDVDPFDYLYAYKYILPLILIVGLLTTPFPLTILIRRRMWLRHEGYLYLTAYLIASIVLLVISCLPKALYFFNTQWHIADTAESICKIWSFLVHVIVSSDWLLVALLADVYLRCHMRIPPGRFSAFGCRNFAGKYCTLFGAKFIIGLTFAASLLVNWWCLAAAHLFLYTDDQYICHLSVVWYEELWLWRFLSNCVTQYVPVVIVTPLLCLMIVVANHRRRKVSMETIVDGIDEDDGEQLMRLSLGVGCTAFLLKSPHWILEMIIQTRQLWVYSEIAIAWYATEFVMAIQLLVFPILCIGLLRETRAAVQTLRLDRFGQRRF